MLHAWGNGSHSIEALEHLALPVALAGTLVLAGAASGRVIHPLRSTCPDCTTPRGGPHLIAHVDRRSVARLQELPAPRGGPFGRGLVGVARANATAATVLAALPATWCGDTRATDDTSHEVANGTYSYHAIYALPAGTNDQFTARASALQADAFEASELIERQYGRAIRYDMGTSCGGQYLDISVVHLPQSAAELSARSGVANTILGDVGTALAKAGFDTLPLSSTTTVAATKRKNFIVWLEGVMPEGGLCGVGSEYVDKSRAASNWNNYGGKLAIVFREKTGFCDSNTLRHEIGHTLGALQSSAPNAFDGAHCNDAYQDTMCYPSAPKRGTGGYQGQYFDYGNDDYWDPKGGALPWWAANLNRFLCADVACNVPARDSGILGLGKVVDGLDLFDGDGDGVDDALNSCPLGEVVGNGVCGGGNTSGASGSEVSPLQPLHDTGDAKVAFGARRAGKGRWRVTFQVASSGHVMLKVRCKTGALRRTVFRRRVAGPVTVRTRVRCASKPRGAAKPV